MAGSTASYVQAGFINCKGCRGQHRWALRRTPCCVAHPKYRSGCVQSDLRDNSVQCRLAGSRAILSMTLQKTLELRNTGGLHNALGQQIVYRRVPQGRPCNVILWHRCEEWYCFFVLRMRSRRTATALSGRLPPVVSEDGVTKSDDLSELRIIERSPGDAQYVCCCVAMGFF